MKKLRLSNQDLGETFESLKLSNAEAKNLVGGCWCVYHGAFCGGNSAKD